MRTIYMVCRSEKEPPNALIKLMMTLFPECELHIICETSSGCSTGSAANSGSSLTSGAHESEMICRYLEEDATDEEGFRILAPSRCRR